MFKYIKFGFKFFLTYYFYGTYDSFGTLPFKTTPGTVAKVITGGMFKYTEFFVFTSKNGWICFESDEDRIKQTKEYKEYQQSILKDLRQLKEDTQNSSIDFI